jgi:hypothetical protein
MGPALDLRAKIGLGNSAQETPQQPTVNFLVASTRHVLTGIKANAEINYCSRYRWLIIFHTTYLKLIHLGGNSDALCTHSCRY